MHMNREICPGNRSILQFSREMVIETRVSITGDREKNVSLAAKDTIMKRVALMAEAAILNLDEIAIRCEMFSIWFEY